MAYATNGLIEDIHYNAMTQVGGGAIPGIANGINEVFNTTGVTTFGYGQTTSGSPLPAVLDGNLVSAPEWANLVNIVTQVGAHQGTATGLPAPPIGGDIIAWMTTMVANVNSVATNRLNAVASGPTNATTQTRNTQWRAQVTNEHTINFGSLNASRYFFNAGGLIRITMSRSGGSASTKNTSWTNLCNNCGTVVLSADEFDKTIAGQTYTGTTKLGGGGTAPTVATGIGFYQLGGGFAQIFNQSASNATYAANDIRITATDDGAGVLKIRVEFKDDTADVDGTVTKWANGTLTSTVTAVQPSTANLANTWGGAPALASSQISGS